MSKLSRVLLLALILSSSGPATAEDGPPKISAATKDDDGFLVHEVSSPFQAGKTLIKVLTPDKLEAGRKYPVVYVLPVEAGTENRYGNGLGEVKKLDLANKKQAIFVAPTFSHLPWYADHPTKPEIRQESYFLKVVVPFIDKTYPTKDRMLLGFSKSGWGAITLLLRNPSLFARAVAWDAPLMMDKPGPYGSGDIFGTPANFAGYQISKLLESNAGTLRQDKRLMLTSYGNFRAEHQKAHALMDQLKIPHDHRDGPARKHDWHSGWVAEAADLLLASPNEAK